MSMTTSGGGGALIPQDMDQAMRLATAMANAKMVPKHLQGDVGSCLMVVEQAMRWRASPFAVAQCTSNIGGKLAYEGKLIAAILPSCGATTGELNYEYHGDPKKPDSLSVTVTGVRASDGDVKSITLEWSKAKTDNKYWVLQPEQQLCYAGARVWARRWTPGPLLGIYAPEEFDEPKRDNFVGTTIEAKVEDPPPLPPTPKKQTSAQWLDELDQRLRDAEDREHVDNILAEEKTKRMAAWLTNGAKQKYNVMVTDALARVSPEEFTIENDPNLEVEHV